MAGEQKISIDVLMDKYWVPEHCYVEDNEIANEHTRLGSETNLAELLEPPISNYHRILSEWILRRINFSWEDSSITGSQKQFDSQWTCQNRAWFVSQIGAIKMSSGGWVIVDRSYDAYRALVFFLLFILIVGNHNGPSQS